MRSYIFVMTAYVNLSKLFYITIALARLHYPRRIFKYDNDHLVIKKMIILSII